MRHGRGCRQHALLIRLVQPCTSRAQRNPRRRDGPGRRRGETAGRRRARWARAAAGAAAPAELLAAVADRRWAVRACLRRLAPDAAAQAALIEYGLAETERQAGPGAARAGLAAGPAAAAGATWAAEGGGADEGDDVQGEWLRLRIRLLQHRERLATLLALHDGCVLHVK